MLERTPDWRAFQNRILGPVIIGTVSALGLDFFHAHMLVQFGFWIATCLAIYVLLTRLGRSPQQAALMVAFFALGCMFLQHRRALIWDNIDLLVMTFLLYLILVQARLGYFIALFAFAILNRESALFIALFVMIDAFDLSRFSLRPVIRNWQKLWSGAAMMLVGLVYVKLSRSLLFIETAGGHQDEQHRLLGNHIHLINNLRAVFKDNWFNAQIAHTLPIVLWVLFLLVSFPTDSETRRKVTLLTLAVLANIMLFGGFNETRILLPMLPLMIFYWTDRFTTPYPLSTPNDVGAK